MKLTVEELARATSAELYPAGRYVDHMNLAMQRFQINTEKRVSAFLATVAIESARLTAVEEGLYYSDPARLAKLFPRAFKSTEAATPYIRNPSALSKILYQVYHGRGLIQLTWIDNYRKAGNALAFNYVATPALLLQPQHATLTAAWYWSVNGCNEAADRGDMMDVTRRVNGPALLHIAERTAQYLSNLKWIKG